MARIDDLLIKALSGLGPKPADSDGRAIKKRYSERLSEVVALAVAEELRLRGLKEARPASPGELDLSGAERRMAGGLGAKRVDVTWSTEAAGLLLAISDVLDDLLKIAAERNPDFYEFDSGNLRSAQ